MAWRGGATVQSEPEGLLSSVALLSAGSVNDALVNQDSARWVAYTQRGQGQGSRALRSKAAEVNDRVERIAPRVQASFYVAVPPRQSDRTKSHTHMT